ncbi:MAG: L-aspartate oxidase [Thermomicrobiales bacterium]|nr:L-aspartate oxidase [Thermomicrobiales bacterium]
MSPDALDPNSAPPPMPRKSYDVIVVGAGVAGLAFTLSLPADLRVALLTKGALGESNTRYAQGGLSAAVGPDDSPALHAEDTLAAGAGLSDPEAVATLVAGAPEAVAWLTALGAAFDTGPNGEILLGREAAHSRRRVLHAGGDATGAEIERALVARVREDRNVDVFAGAFVVDLVVVDGRCRGVVAELSPDTDLTLLEAPVTVLAAGGAGHLWATTSNPLGATADGLALALRAGATVADTEFVQFHPTVLAVPGATPFLVSEAVRGEGAYLRDAAGERFMLGTHPLAELAPRDVVARGIQQQMAHDQRDHVDLDLRHLDPDEVRARFPTITSELAARGLDLATDAIPVAPAAHYFIGGVVADTEGQTSLPGLLAFGEAASTGIHGANRLASNSLLEGLVFGMAGADRLARQWPLIAAEAATFPPVPDLAPPRVGLGGDAAALRRRLQRAMSQDVAVVRDTEGLARASATIDAIEAEAHAQVGAPTAERRERWELRNLVDAARSVVENATFREESRGAHYRSDFPATNPDLAGEHTLRDQAGTLRYGKLATALPAGSHR